MALPATIGKYRIDKLIKRGGMGAVYLGFDPELKRPAAIKVLRDDLDDGDAQERFKREAVAVAALRHPNIVTIYHADVDDGRPYIAMEYIPGESLAELIRRNAPMSLPRKLQIVEDICRALAAAHRAGIVHRDIKPANVMVDGEEHVILLDFGIARTPDATLTQTGAFVGTLSYMAPEQLTDGTQADHRSDVFAVGAVLFELIAGKPAFPRGVPGAAPGEAPLLSDVSDAGREVSAVVAKALRMDPATRYKDVETLRTDLADVRSAVEAGRTVISKRLWPRPQPAVPAAPPPTPDTVRVSRPPVPAASSRQLRVSLVVALAGFTSAMVWFALGTGEQANPQASERPPDTVASFEPLTVPAAAPSPSAPVPAAPESPALNETPVSPIGRAYAPAKPAAPLTPAAAARRMRTEVIEVAYRYLEALNTRDLTQVAAIRRLDPEEREQLQMLFRRQASFGQGEFPVVRVDPGAGVATIRGSLMRSLDGKVATERVELRFETVDGRLMIVSHLSPATAK